MIVDCFAGPGGWDEGAAMIGRHDVVEQVGNAIPPLLAAHVLASLGLAAQAERAAA